MLGRFPWICKFYLINEAHKQYSLLDTIFNYIFYFGPPGKHLYLCPKKPPTYDRFSWLVYNVRYNILYLTDYIAYGFHLCFIIWIGKEICRKPISQHPGLGKGLLNHFFMYASLHILIVYIYIYMYVCTQHGIQAGKIFACIATAYPTRHYM